MSSADRLIRELKAGGRVDSDGEFTLDRDKAREKMRQFQLADPRQYVLLLVQAAVLKGARTIDFRIDADDVRMAFDGDPFGEDDFDGVYGSLFSRQADPATRARRELALGLNSAMALHPRYIRVESGDGRAGTFLELRPDAPDRFGPCEPAPRGTTLHVKERFRPGLAVSFVRNLSGTLAEERYLRDRCGFSGVDITLDGKPVSGLRTAFFAPCPAQVPVKGPGIQGTLGVSANADEPGRVCLIANGVHFGWQAFESLPFGVVAILESDRFAKDVSQSAIVQDEAYAAAIDAVAGAWEDALDSLCDRHDRLSRIGRGGELEERLRAACRFDPDPFRDWAAGGTEPSKTRRKLGGLPIWPSVDGSNMSIADVVSRTGKGDKVAFGTRTARLESTEWRAVPFIGTAEDRAFFDSLFGDRLEDRTAELAAEARREEARREWRTRAAEPKLWPGDWAGRIPIQGRGFHGEAGLDPRLDGISSFRWHAEGCILGHLRIQLPIPSVHAAVEGPFTPGDDYSDARRDDAFATAVGLVVDGIASLAGRLAQAPASGRDPARVRTLTLQVLWALSTRPPGVEILNVFGYPDPEVERLSRGGESAWLDVALLDSLRSLKAGLEVERPHPLIQAPLFPSTSGRYESLADLARRIAATGAVRYLVEEPGQAPSEPLPVLSPSSLALKTVRRIFGPDFLVDATPDLVRAARARKHASQPVEPAMVLVPTLVSERLRPEQPGLDGELAVPDPPVRGRGTSPEWPPTAGVRLFKDHRHLVDLELPMPAGPLACAVNCDSIQPDRDWLDVSESEALASLHRELIATSRRVVANLAAGLDRLPRQSRNAAGRFLLAALAAPFPTPRFREVFEVLKTTGSAVPYRALLEAAATRDLSEVENALGLVLEDKDRAKDAPGDLAVDLDALLKPPEEDRERTPQDIRSAACGSRVAAALGEWIVESQGGVRFSPPAALLDAPVLVAADGRPVTVREALDTATRRGSVLRVPERVPEGGLAGTNDLILCLDDRTAEIARRLLPLEDGSEALRTLRRAATLAALPVRGELHVPANLAMVTRRIEAPGIEGEIGLTAMHAGDSAVSTIEVCCRRRRIAVIEHFRILGIVAVVNDDSLALTGDCTGITEADRERILKVCEDSLPGLATDLAGILPGLGGDDRQAAWRHALDLMSALVQGRGTDSGVLDRPGVSALADIEGFRGADGQAKSLRAVVESARRHEAAFLVSEATPAGPLLEPDRVVLAPPAYERERLRGILPRVTDWDDEWAEEREGVARRAGARPLPAPDPGELLAWVDIQKCGLDGMLYLPRIPVAPLLVSFGSGGLEAGAMEISDGLPCAGTVSGPELSIGRLWDSVDLTGAQRAYLESRAARLYRNLAGKYAKARPGPDGDRIRQVLVDTLLSARKALPKVRGSASREALKQVCDDLAKLPLFELGSGEALTLPEVLRRKPVELERLGLWEPKPPADLREAPVAKPPAPVVAQPGPEVEDLPTPPAQPRPAPAPPPPAPPPSPEDRLVAALRRLLRPVDGPGVDLKGDLRIDRIVFDRGAGTVASCTGERLVLHGGHPLVRKALAAADPVLDAFLASAVFTVVNHEYEDVSDDQEDAYQDALIAAIEAEVTTAFRSR